MKKQKFIITLKKTSQLKSRPVLYPTILETFIYCKSRGIIWIKPRREIYPARQADSHSSQLGRQLVCQSDLPSGVIRYQNHWEEKIRNYI